MTLRIHHAEPEIHQCDPAWRKFIDDQTDDPRFIDAHNHRNRSRDIASINQGIREKGRVVVGLGCSFTEGQAAFPEWLVDRIRPRGGNASNFNYEGKGHDMAEMMAIASEYLIPLKVINTAIWNKSVNHLAMETRPLEIDNSFVNHFAELNDYVPINLGNCGNGNQATINRLFAYPIDWHLCDDIIVLWCYSDQERYDLLNDSNIDYSTIKNDHVCMWPKEEAYDPGQEKFHQGDDWHNLQLYFTRTMRSDTFSYMNFVQQGIQLDTWCKAHGANLMTFGAFSDVDRTEITKAHTHNTIIRNHAREITNGRLYPPGESSIEANTKVVDKFPWHSVIDLAGEKNFIKFALRHEDDPDLMDLTMWQIIDQGGSKNDWVFPCGHPSGKAHQALAQKLSDLARDRNFL